MKTLVAAIQKGGQGKSMLSTHLAWMAAEMGKSVLAVDFDSQGTFSRNLSAEFDQDNSASFGLVTGQHPQPALIPLPFAAKGRIELLSGDKRLVQFDEAPELLVSALRGALSAFKGFDLCVIDPPPTLGKRLRAALMTANFVVMPFTPARESVDGLGDLLATIEEVKQEYNPGLHVLGLLPNKVNSRSKAEQQTIKDIRAAAPGMLLPLQINERTSICGAMAASRPVWLGTGGESHRLAAGELRAACKHILNTVFKK